MLGLSMLRFVKIDVVRDLPAHLPAIRTHKT
jgi:hypothetical protein